MNNQTNFLLALLLLPFLTFNTFAQDPDGELQQCANNEEREAAYAEWLVSAPPPPADPDSEGFAGNNFLPLNCTDNMVIPVVFYMFYDDNNGFVSEQRVLDQFAELQTNFAGSGIQLCLATEYNGSIIPLPTGPGVVQASQSATNPGIIWVKHPALANYLDWGTASHYQATALSVLPHDRYLRIFCSPGLAGAYGVAAYPSSPPAEQSILMLSDIIGNSISCMGFCPPNADHGRILAHEVGHYFGLMHIWAGSCGTPATWPGCRTAGDFICDTPPQLGHSGCTQTSTCGFTDIMDNFMDYTPDVCMQAFTPGQIKSMRESLVIRRQLLWDPANVAQANPGCVPNQYPCSTDVDFTYSVAGNCDVQFTDLSVPVNGEILGRHLWDFGDGSAMDFEPNPSHTYPGPGTYTVTLYVESCEPGGGNYCSCQHTQQVVVSCTPTVCAANACLVSFTQTGPLTYQFDASCSTGSGPLTYKWFFADGGTATTTNPVHTHVHSQAVYSGFVTLQVCSTLGVTTCDDFYYFSMDVLEPCLAVASFTWAQGNDCEIVFTNTSQTSWLGSPQYDWDFGDGSPTSQLHSPTHTYNAPGTYTVQLDVAVFDGLGWCYDTVQQQVTVTCTDPCYVDPDFTFSSQGACGFTFIDTSIPDPFTTIINQTWTFGFGMPQNGGQVNVTFPASGWYQVCLTIDAINIMGQQCQFVECQLINVDCNIACANAVNFNSVVTGCTVDFFEAVTGDPYNSLSWDFGDGNTSTSPNPQHTYGSSGTYNVCLTAECIDPFTGLPHLTTLCQPVTVSCTSVNCAPLGLISFTTSVDPVSCEVTFCLDQNLDPSLYCATWDFGDGTTPVNLPVGQCAQHLYGCSGSYTVCVTVTCCNDPTISAQACATYSHTCGGCNLPSDITFLANVSSTGCDIEADLLYTTLGCPGEVCWEWDFGDGSNPVTGGTTVFHTYAASGTYTITLTVYCCADPNISYTVTQQVTVNCGCTAPSSIDFNWSTNPATCETEFCPLHQLDPTVYCAEWDFGDGTVVQWPVDQCPVHVYACAGTYTVCLTVYCCSDTTVSTQLCYNVTITCGSCNIPTDVGFIPSISLLGCDVDFNLTYTTLGCPGELCWSWDFGDGSPIVTGGTQVSHTYASNGPFTVVLSVFCCNDPSIGYQVTQTVGVNCIQPCPEPCEVFAGFVWTMYPITQANGCCLDFESNSHSNSFTTITGYSWDFGDGNSSTAQNPSHCYSVPGTYSVSLTVTGQSADGTCTDTFGWEVICDCQNTCPCDIDENGIIQIADLLAFLNCFSFNAQCP